MPEVSKVDYSSKANSSNVRDFIAAKNIVLVNVDNKPAVKTRF